MRSEKNILFQESGFFTQIVLSLHSYMWLAGTPDHSAPFGLASSPTGHYTLQAH